VLKFHKDRYRVKPGTQGTVRRVLRSDIVVAWDTGVTRLERGSRDSIEHVKGFKRVAIEPVCVVCGLHAGGELCLVEGER